MLKNKFVIIAIISISLLVLGGLVYLLVASTTDTQTETEKSVTIDEQPAQVNQPKTSNEILIYGDSAAKVKIVEYIDYKCPNCNRFHRGVAKEIDSIYGSQVAYEVRAYPAFGPDSGRALRGAYCANDQNIFPEYHNSVMDYMWNEYYEDRNYAVEIEDILTSDLLVNLINSTSADKDKFRQCIDSTEKNALIDRDLLSAADDGIRGTPGFVISGQSFVGLQPQSVFTALIGKELTN